MSEDTKRRRKLRHRQTKTEKLPVYVGVAGGIAGCFIGLFTAVALFECGVGAEGPRLLPNQISVSPGPWLLVTFFGTIIIGGLVGLLVSSWIWTYFRRRPAARRQLIDSSNVLHEQD